MKRSRPFGNGRFLIEFLVVLLILILTSPIVFELFVQGSVTSTQAYDLNRAVVQAETITDTVMASGGEEESLSRAFARTADGYRLYFDSEWQETDAAGSTYLAQISVLSDEDMLVCDVVIQKDGAEIYSLGAKRYLGMMNNEDEAE